MKQRLLLMLLLAIGCIVISKQSNAKSNPLPLQTGTCVTVTDLITTKCVCADESGEFHVGTQNRGLIETAAVCGTRFVHFNILPCDAEVPCNNQYYFQEPCRASACVAFWDNDGDGHGPPCCGGGDCDDSNAAIHPQRPEICDGIDNNCNGQTDE
jgi:hypothetical protein